MFCLLYFPQGIFHLALYLKVSDRLSFLDFLLVMAGLLALRYFHREELHPLGHLDHR